MRYITVSHKSAALYCMTKSIATDFSEKARRDGEYAYDPDGRLSHDSNKEVTLS